MTVLIEETAPRDGLQNEAAVWSVEERIQLIEELVDCGVPSVQVGSFVNPRAVPQMADTEQVFRGLKKRPGVVYRTLVFNEKGLERAGDCGVEHVAVFVSASETHSLRNSGCDIKEALRRAVLVVRQAKANGLAVQAGVMNAFGCRFDGVIPESRVFQLASVLVEAGADELCLADTSGCANPRQMEYLVETFLRTFSVPLALHLHDTYGFGLANVFAAWKLGVIRFDGACGGLGGCPFIPGAAGNIPTEDLAHFFHAMGEDTGIDLERLMVVRAFLESRFQRKLLGRYGRITCPI
ncbi:MAG: hydroxymethylglutaryl-CoA lyase [Desulfosoma sp.]